MNELIKRAERIRTEIETLTGHLSLYDKRQSILELEDTMQTPQFWDDNEHAQIVSQKYTKLKNLVDFWTNLAKQTTELIELLEQNTDESSETKSYLEAQCSGIEKQYLENRIVALLSKKYDDHNAIIAIHAGAGGTDAQDWAEMLMRMYLRYCAQKGFKTEVLELHKGQEAGIKSAIIEVHGSFAYGYLRSEAGVHRLVRQSPFNPAHTRETSFALLELLPILEAKESLILDPKDLEIEANTASGHGGQSVNTTYSAIRITHIPTGIKVSIQNERSQHQNKELALKILTARLQALEYENLAKEKKDLRGEFKSAEWGNQIRSYVLHPYKLVKDQRTNYEETDPEKVLNGELDSFIDRYLEANL